MNPEDHLPVNGHSEKPKEVLTAEELAKHLKVAKQTILYHSRGKHPRIPHYRVGRSPRYDLQTALKALSRGKAFI